MLVLEQLARDVTGWGAHAVEFFQVLGDTQYLNHLRLRNLYAPDLRRWQNGLYSDRAFDRTCASRRRAAKSQRAAGATTSRTSASSSGRSARTASRSATPPPGDERARR